MRSFVGIDVGGPGKGFHAVALHDGIGYDTTVTTDPSDLAIWCRNFDPPTIAIDAPCRWSLTGRARQSERALMAKRIWCFSTPTWEVAANHPKQQFGWMLQGERAYAALSGTHPIYDGTRVPGRGTCIETFPHAIVCALRGTVTSARNKMKVRRQVLTDLGINVKRLKGIDLIDAALCAVAAREFTRGAFTAYGDGSDGVIIVPRQSRPEIDGPLSRRVE